MTGREILKRVQDGEAIKKVEIASSLTLLAMTPSKDTGFRIKSGMTSSEGRMFSIPPAEMPALRFPASPL